MHPSHCIVNIISPLMPIIPSIPQKEWLKKRNSLLRKYTCFGHVGKYKRCQYKCTRSHKHVT